MIMFTKSLYKKFLSNNLQDKFDAFFIIYGLLLDNYMKTDLQIFLNPIFFLFWCFMTENPSEI